jgi:sulfur-oxidizing protein SoxY
MPDREPSRYRRHGISRRRAIAAIGAATIAPQIASASGPSQLATAIADITRGKPVTQGRVKLVLPELAENGNLVSLAVSADLPMTPAQYVKTIHIVSEKNPNAIVARYHLTPAMGQARVASSIRLADTQKVVALAEMSDGTFYAGEAGVVVTLAACLDGG